MMKMPDIRALGEPLEFLLFQLQLRKKLLLYPSSLTNSHLSLTNLFIKQND